MEFFDILFIISFLINQSTPSIVTTPRHSVASIGQGVRLDCSTDLDYPMTWWFTPYGSTKAVEFYFSRKVLKNYASRYRVETNKKGHYTLVIENVDQHHAGRYSCYDNDGDDEVGVSAELNVVLDHQDSIVENLVNRSTEMKVFLRYTGTLKPVVVWSVQGTIHERIVALSDGVKEIETTLRASHHTEDKVYKCKIHFEGVHCGTTSSNSLHCWTSTFTVNKTRDVESIFESSESFLKAEDVRSWSTKPSVHLLPHTCFLLSLYIIFLHPIRIQ